MKNILLPVLAGVMMIGSVSALPTPADRKALCERHPDKYVWVEKTETCVPNDPCSLASGGGENYNAYCVEIEICDASLDDAQLDSICRQKLERTLKSKIKGEGKYKYYDESDNESRYSYYMENGMYMGCEVNFNGTICINNPDEPEPKWAATVRGVDKACTEFGGVMEGELDCMGIKSKGTCRDIADRASLYNDCLVFMSWYNSDDKDCRLLWELACYD